MQQGSCCKLPVIFPGAIEFCRDGFSVLFHAVNMEVQCFIHIMLQLIQSLPGRDTGDIFIYRPGCVIISIINKNPNFTHNTYFFIRTSTLLVSIYYSIFPAPMLRTMTSFLCNHIPSVCLKQVDNFFNLVSSHRIIDGSKI